MSYTIPVFARLNASNGRYRLPSGRIAVIVDASQHATGAPCVTLEYVDMPGEYITIRKSWLNRHGRIA